MTTLVSPVMHIEDMRLNKIPFANTVQAVKNTFQVELNFGALEPSYNGSASLSKTY